MEQDKQLSGGSTTTSSQAKEVEERYCNICKASKGHYTNQHEDWIALSNEEEQWKSEQQAEEDARRGEHEAEMEARAQDEADRDYAYAQEEAYKNQGGPDGE